MEQNFSERFGFVEPMQKLALDAFPDSLRNGLWNICHLHSFSELSDIYQHAFSPRLDTDTLILWHHFFRLPNDERPTRPTVALADIRHYFFTSRFFKVFDLIEFIYSCSFGNMDRNAFSKGINSVLTRELCAYRLVDGKFVLVTDPVEIASIDRAIGSEADGVRKHIKRAAELLSSREAPDYRNSIKEAISAVEAAVAFVAGTACGGVKKPLKKAIDDYVLHPSLRDGFEKLYAYTSDSRVRTHKPA